MQGVGLTADFSDKDGSEEATAGCGDSFPAAGSGAE